MSRRLLLAVSGLLIGAIVLLDGIQLVLDRRDSLGVGERHAANLAEVLSQHSTRVLTTVDQALLELADQLAGIEDPAAIRRLIQERHRATANVLAFVIVGPDGQPRHSSLGVAGDPLDLSQRAGFEALRHDPGPGPFIHRPILGEVDATARRWVLGLSRRLRSAPDGSFAGVVAAAVSLEGLLGLYRPLSVGDGGAIALYRQDGVLLARTPFDGTRLGRRFAGFPQLQARIEEAPTGSFRAIENGVARVGAYRSMPELGVVLVVGLAEADLLARWRNRVLIGFVSGGLLVGLIGGLAVGLDRSLGRREAEQEAHAARLGRLAAATTELANADRLEHLLERTVALARELIPAHQGILSLTRNEAFAQSIHAVSLSERYAAWRGYDEAVDGTGIYRLVCTRNAPMRLTQAELERHPAWRGFGPARERHPPLRGWLAAPLVGAGGANLGLIQLSDRESGEFSAEDEAILVQLTRIASVAIKNFRLIGELRQAIATTEEARAEAERERGKLERILNSIVDAFYVLDHDFRFVQLNPQTEILLGCEREALLGRRLWEVFPALAGSHVQHEYERSRAEGVVTAFEFLSERLQKWLEVRAFPYENGLAVVFRDVSQRVQMEEQLRHAQRMEAIGQLTGGIAHDFNNMLTVILGNTDLLVEALAHDPELRETAAMARSAGERAVELTERLLAFARRQALEPVALDVNRLLASLEGMLRRTLDAHIDITLARERDLWPALVDPAQLENVILNLAINARDAMPNGGKLIIETANVRLDEHYAAMHQEVTAGAYVLVAVTDNGAGMSPEVAARAFEPFFTTKGPGRGSGLGLSMAYGFIKQSGGHITIYSEPGAGTTVKLYLPRAPGHEADPGAEEPGRIGPAGGDERILVVEDEDLVRSHFDKLLRSLGYTVTVVSDAAAALDRLGTGQAFDLLLTDVMLPGDMNGRQLAEAAAALRPGFRVLYTSGYSENAIIHHGRLDPGVLLLHKPFSRQELASKVRTALGTA